MKLRSIALVIVLIVIVLVCINIVPGKAANESESIYLASSSINQAFTEVLSAEAAGGNITGLLVKLNGAGELLSEAERSYQNGDLTDVNSKADSAILIANQVRSDASTLIVSSRSNSENELLLKTSFSVIAIAIFLFSLLLIWRRVERGYYRKMLHSEPEVVNDQA